MLNTGNFSGRITQIAEESLESPYPDMGWEALQAVGELDAAILRYRAVGMAAAETRKAGWTPATSHAHLAGLEVAIAHGYPHWSAMQLSLSSQPSLWALIETFRHELSLAKCFREHLFGKTENNPPALSWSYQRLT